MKIRIKIILLVLISIMKLSCCAVLVQNFVQKTLQEDESRLYFLFEKLLDPQWNVYVRRNCLLKGKLSFSQPAILMDRRNFINEDVVYIENSFRATSKSDVFIFMDKDLTKIFYETYRSKIWNRKALFIIYGDDTFQTDILSILEKMFLFKVIFITKAILEKNQVLILRRTYDSGCEHTFFFSAINREDVWENIRNAEDISVGEFKSCTVFMGSRYNKPLITVRGKKPSAQMDIKNSGCTVMTIAILFEKLNMNLMWWSNQAGNCIIPISNNIELYDGKTNFSCAALHSIALCPFTNTKLNYIWVDSIIVTIAFPKPIPGWKIICFVLTKSAWLAQSFLTVIVILIWTFPSTIVRRKCNWNQLIKNFFKLLPMNLGFAAHITDSLLSSRVIILASVLYSFFFINLFQAKYIDLMSNPPLERKLSSLDDLEKNRITLYLHFNAMEHLLRENPGLKFLDYEEVVAASNLSLSEVFGEKKAAYMHYQQNIRPIYSKVRDNGGPRLMVLSSFKAPRPLSITLLLKDHPLKSYLNRRIGEMQEGGFIDKFYEDTKPLLDYHPNTPEYFPWSFGHLQSGIIILFVGYSLAALVLIVEITWGSIRGIKE